MAINIGYFGLSLNTANLSGDPFLNCFLFAMTEVPAYIVSTFLLKSCPRRPLLSAFLIIGGGFLLLLPDKMAGKFGFTMSFTVVYIYTAELYPTVLRNLGPPQPLASAASPRHTSYSWARISALAVDYRSPGSPSVGESPD
ncbi:unnamed protein product [Leuciscus chuanchicus]